MSTTRGIQYLSVVTAIILAGCVSLGSANERVEAPPSSASRAAITATCLSIEDARDSTQTRLEPLESCLSSEGVVCGVLSAGPERKSSGPVGGLTVYIAEILFSSEGPSGLASMDEVSAPSATVDEVGRFVFTNVKPGMYALIVKTPVSLLVVHDVITGQDVVFEVNQGSGLDLGVIVPNLPF